MRETTFCCMCNEQSLSRARYVHDPIVLVAATLRVTSLSRSRFNSRISPNEFQVRCNYSRICLRISDVYVSRGCCRINRQVYAIARLPGHSRFFT